MSEPSGKEVNYFHRLWQKIMGRIIQDVPEDYQACEFECRKLQCAMGDWEKCARRLRSKALNQEHLRKL
jgi:hypothetical protein